MSNANLLGEEMSKKGLQQHFKFSMHHKLTQIIILPRLFQTEKQFCCCTRPDTLIQMYWASTYYQQCTRRLGCQQTSSLFSSVSTVSFMSSYLWFPKKYRVNMNLSITMLHCQIITQRCNSLQHTKQFNWWEYSGYYLFDDDKQMVVLSLFSTTCIAPIAIHCFECMLSLNLAQVYELSALRNRLTVPLGGKTQCEIAYFHYENMIFCVLLMFINEVL